MKEEERRRRRPPERERDTHTHTHRAEPGRDIKWPFFFPSSHCPVKFQTKAATSKQGEIFSRVASPPSCSSSRLLPPPIYPS
jgi:hypothetical protein